MSEVNKIRYQVVFVFHGVSHTLWLDDLNSARRFAAPLARSSCYYDVAIFEHSASGVREVEITA